MSILLRYCKMPKLQFIINGNNRNISRCAVKFEKSPATESATNKSSSSTYVRMSHRPNNLEKRILVWTGRYKSMNEIPELVSHEAVEKARNKARIRISNYMMLATAIACVAMVVSGKRAAERGETVHKMNLDWHQQINKEAKEAQNK